jgi:hypothetical protein
MAASQSDCKFWEYRDWRVPTRFPTSAITSSSSGRFRLMITSQRVSFISFAAAFLIAVACGQAAVITFSAATAIVDSNDISTYGMSVDALHTNPNAGDLVVGDETFHKQTTTSAAGVFTGSTTHISLQTTGPGGAGNNSTNALPPPAVTGNYASVLAYLDYGSNNLGDPVVHGTLTLSGLKVNQSYQVQIWSLQRDFLNYVTTYTSGANSVSLHLNPGEFTLGSFTADAVTQSLTIQNTGGGAFYYGVNAVALRELPEPGSLALLGCAGILCARRKSR